MVPSNFHKCAQPHHLLIFDHNGEHKPSLRVEAMHSGNLELRLVSLEVGYATETILIAGTPQCGGDFGGRYHGVRYDSIRSYAHKTFE